MNPILRYECGRCGTIHSSRKEAEGCCPTPIDTVYQCSECDSNFYDAVWAEACCTRTKMDNSDRDPDAIDRDREDASVLGRTCGYCNFTGDMMAYAQHVCHRDVMQSEIDSLRAQLAAVTERERRINQRAEILFDGIQGAHDMVTRWLADPSAPATEKLIELAGLLETQMDVTGRRPAAALAAAQPASDPENNNG